MSTDKGRRAVRAPQRFAEEAEGAKKQGPTRKSVYRLLRKKDVSRDLLDKQLHILWPDDGTWYAAEIKELKVSKLQAEVEYTETDEVEKIDLAQLIKNGEIALIESRPQSHKCRKDEIPVEGSGGVRPVAATDSDEDDPDAGEEPDSEDEEADEEGPDSSDSDAEEADDPEEQIGTPAGNFRADTRALSSSGKRARVAAAAAGLAAKRAKLESGLQADAQPESPKPRTGAGSSAKPVYGRTDSITSAGRSTGQLHGGAHDRKLERHRSDVSTGSVGHRGVAAAQHDNEIRDKVRAQFSGAFEKALDELRAEGFAPQEQHTPQQVAAQLELAMFKLFGGAGKEYKAKFRSLGFNLKDAANPELRARVLQGELTPDALVRMTPNELASRELSRWRVQKAEEALKASVLDEDTAAQFSTAAALAAKKGHRNATQAGLLSARDPSPEPVANDTEERNGNHVGSVSAMDLSVGDVVLDPDLAIAAPPPVTSPPPPPLGKQPSAEEAQQRRISLDAGPGSGSLPSGSAAAKGGIDWASIKAEAVKAAAEPGNDLPSFEAFEDFKPSADEQPDPASDTAPDNTTSIAAAAASPGKDDAAPQSEPGAGAGAVPDSPPPPAPPSPGPPGLEPLVAAAAELDALGQEVWQGRLHLAGTGRFAMVARAAGGQGDWSQILNCSEVEIKGRVALEKVEAFMEELRQASRHRTVTLATLTAPPDPPPDKPYVHQIAAQYVEKGRAGVAEPERGLEAYLLPPGRLAERLLKTARRVGGTPAAAAHRIPSELPDDTLLLAIVHPKDFKSARRSAASRNPVRSPSYAPNSPKSPHKSPAHEDLARHVSLDSPARAKMTSAAAPAPSNLSAAVSQPVSAPIAGTFGGPEDSGTAASAALPVLSPELLAILAAQGVSAPQGVTAAPAGMSNGDPRQRLGVDASQQQQQQLPVQPPASGAGLDPRRAPPVPQSGATPQAGQMQQPPQHVSPPHSQQQLPPPPPASSAPGAGQPAPQGGLALPAGLDLSNLGALAAALGIAGRAAPASVPPAATQPPGPMWQPQPQQQQGQAQQMQMQAPGQYQGEDPGRDSRVAQQQQPQQWPPQVQGYSAAPQPQAGSQQMQGFPSQQYQQLPQQQYPGPPAQGQLPPPPALMPYTPMQGQPQQQQPQQQVAPALPRPITLAPPPGGPGAVRPMRRDSGSQGYQGRSGRGRRGGRGGRS